MAEPRWSLHFAWGRAPYALDLPEVVIGRGDRCTLQIEEPTAADEHARFVVGDDDSVWLESVHADRDTLLNGRTIVGRTQLHDGDFVQIGHAVLTLRATVRRAVRSAPEARTIAGEMPEEVRQLMAARAAKNFVVGQSEPSTLSTVMMASPLALKTIDAPNPRDIQQTVQANVDDLMAAVRQHATESRRVSVPEDLSFASVEPTLVPEATKVSDGPPLAHGDDSRSHRLPPLQLTTPIPVASPLPPGGSGPTELPSEPTVIAPPQPMRTSGGARPRTFSNPELTPLPPITPPTPSIADLGPLVNQVLLQSDPLATSSDPAMDVEQDTDRNPKMDVDVPLGSAPTMLFPAVKDVPPPMPSTVSSSPPPSDPQVSSVTAPTPKVDLPSSDAPKVAAPSSAAPTGETAATSSPDPGPYVAPAKGMFGSFSRALDFFQQMFAYARRDRTLLSPMYRNLTIATIVSVAISGLLFVVRSAGAANGIMVLGLMVLYFIDYQCNALTASLINDYVTTGRADMKVAKARVAKVRSGIMVFAGVSGLLDFFTTYARERSDVVGRILLGIVRSIWTTATYFILPSMVIEGLPFGEAFTASKKKMEVDPTGVGAGIVALSLVSYFIGAIVFPLAFTVSRIGSHLHPAFGMVLFYAMVNVYWAVTGWLKISYSTCFYLWARRCEEAGNTDHANAPLPLRHALDAG